MSKMSISEKHDCRCRFMLSFVTDFVEFLTISPSYSRVGVVVFANSPELSIRLNEYSNRLQLRNRIQQLRHPGGNSDMTAAFEFLRKEAFTGVCLYFLILFGGLLSDGNGNLLFSLLYFQLEIETCSIFCFTF